VKRVNVVVYGRLGYSLSALDRGWLTPTLIKNAFLWFSPGKAIPA